jgi:hypothetical protein
MLDYLEWLREQLPQGAHLSHFGSVPHTRYGILPGQVGAPRDFSVVDPERGNRNLLASRPTCFPCTQIERQGKMAGYYFEHNGPCGSTDRLLE